MNPVRASGEDSIQFLIGSGSAVARNEADATTHWANNDLGKDERTRLACGELSWSIEELHRG
jgi:hypothetical protein